MATPTVRPNQAQPELEVDASINRVVTRICRRELIVVGDIGQLPRTEELGIESGLLAPGFAIACGWIGDVSIEGLQSRCDGAQVR